MAFKLVIYVLSVFFLVAAWPSAKASINGGFSVPLIHRDSPLSPFYYNNNNKSLTPFHRLTGSARRSLSHRHPFQSTVFADFPDSEHLMFFSIGTPPVQVVAVVDTGSSLIWSPCKPCIDCTDQHVPLFDNQASSTYKDIPSDSTICKDLNPCPCNTNEGPDQCNYECSYLDDSFTNGVLALETLTFNSTGGGSTVSFHGVSFGCGHNNSLWFDGYPAGIVGLGRGPSSLVSQLGPSIGWRFSYCLVPFQENNTQLSSVINFGDHAVISGTNVVSTPLLRKGSTDYYVTLERISLGNTSIELAPPPPQASDVSANGNILIDSGSTLTYLEADVFNKLSTALTNSVQIPPTTDPSKSYTLCYNATSRDGFPDMTFHFAGGADLVLHPLNTFTPPSPEGLVCLAMLSTDADGPVTLGNMAQQNFHVAYDLKRNMVSFAPTDCAKLPTSHGIVGNQRLPVIIMDVLFLFFFLFSAI